jgi:CRP-like cAMP-binding protein
VSLEAAYAIARSAIELDLPGGEAVPRIFSEDERFVNVGPLGVVIRGLVRIFVLSDTRQVTIQYASDGDVFAVPLLASANGASRLTSAGQALADSRLLLFSAKTFAELAQRDLTVAGVAINGLRSALYTSISVAVENVLWPLRQRVARHLLDLGRREGREVVVPVTVQDIADATGTVREVVTRLLKEMRQEGLIDREGGKLVLRDLRGLHCVASGEPVPLANSASAS